jgi:signal transduction histidine kinase
MKMQFSSGLGERSGSILDSLPDPVFFFDETGELRYANEAGEALIGGGDGSPRRFCDIVDCGVSTFAQVFDDIVRGSIPDRLRGRTGLERDGVLFYLQVKPVNGGLVCTIARSSAAPPEARALSEPVPAGEEKCQPEDMREIYDLLRKITKSINLDETLDSIVKSMPGVLRLDNCIILLLHGREIKSIKATEHIEKQFGKLRFNIDDLIATREAVDKKRPVVINDAKNNPHISQQLVKMFDSSAVMVLPLIARDRTLGVMWLSDSTVGRRFTELEVEEANLISGQAAIAIDNAMLFKQLSLANRQLEESYERLKSLDSVKMEFFALLSHELRTPLTTIKGYADLLEDGVLGPLNEEQQDKLAKISTGVDRLTKIVDNLADLSSIASKRYTMDIIPVSLGDLIGEAVRGIAFLAERKGISLSLDIPIDLPMVYVDRARIAQVVLNIINNAIKYTPSGGSITIRAKDERDHVLVAVHDTGIGIPKRDLENIFSGFYHAGYKLSYEYKGAGLGLALSKGIIESHGGRIWAESEVGKGSTFYFTLSKSAPGKR